jgi:L-iditol 2-dehydrogenase
MTTYGAGPDDLAEAFNLIRDQEIKVQEMVTHQFSLLDIGKGFRIVAEANESMKVIVKL